MAEHDQRCDPSESLDPEKWVDRHADMLYRYTLSRLRDREAAEDLVQETLLAAFKTRDTFAGQSTERTWLIGILRHKIVDHIRKLTAARGRCEGESDADRAALDDIFDQRGKWRRDPGDWPGDRLTPGEREELRRAIDRCAEKLPPTLAAVFTLRELEQMDSESICQVLTISPTNLWTRLHRMRMMLRQCLERTWLGSPPDSEPPDSDPPDSVPPSASDHDEIP